MVMLDLRCVGRHGLFYDTQSVIFQEIPTMAIVSPNVVFRVCTFFFHGHSYIKVGFDDWLRAILSFDLIKHTALYRFLKILFDRYSKWFRNKIQATQT
jgi:hypothetical protein